MSEPDRNLRFDDVITDQSRSFLQKYQDTVIGSSSLGKLVVYELAMLFANPVPGALGLALRKLLFPALFGATGKGVVYGYNLGLRSPGNIYLGSNTVIDDYVMLGHRGREQKISIGDRCLIGRFTQLFTRGGNIEIGNRVNISGSCHLVSNDKLIIGEHTLIAGGCYIGGLQHRFDDPDTPIVDQGMDNRGGVEIGRDCWLGAHVIVGDGVTIGDGSVIGANSVVTADIPPYSVAVGSPAKVVRQRTGAQ